MILGDFLGDRELIENYYADYCNLIDTLCKLVNDYRLLIGGASELNQITLAHKKDVKKALKLVNHVGDMIEELLDIIEKTGVGYLDYCEIKTIVIRERIEYEYVKSEIENLTNVEKKEDVK